ncbi:MAG: DUF58 domain-containing protein [Rhodobacteraceae bacterium]|nr:DUF58 domain-containing protein [Paracoccaceae bacterium]
MRHGAETAAGGLPDLLVAAQRLAATVILGAHGRRRPGLGETFWQYRRATPGDPLPSVDWRRSARSDALFVRETEWEAAQTVWLWADASASMRYRSNEELPTKGERAALLTAAMAVLLNGGGERIAALRTDAARPSTGEIHLERVVMGFAQGLDAQNPAEDFAAPPHFDAVRGGGAAVFISDFFAPEESILKAMRAAAAQGVTGAVLQVVDPAEEAFPFDGRVRFESMGRSVNYETDRAGALRSDYQAVLAARRDRMRETARRSGWRFSVHRTNDSATPALLWLAQSLAQDFGA